MTCSLNLIEIAWVKGDLTFCAVLLEEVDLDKGGASLLDGLADDLVAFHGGYP